MKAMTDRSASKEEMVQVLSDEHFALLVTRP